MLIDGWVRDECVKGGGSCLPNPQGTRFCSDSSNYLEDIIKVRKKFDP